MKIERIGERNITIIFEDPFPTTTHLVLGDNRTYVCDTFLGTDPMKKVAKIVQKEVKEERPVVVFNSHADWDHIWGNCYFKDSPIIGHKTSRKRIQEEGEADLERWKDNIQGEVILMPPNLLFDTRLVFADDEIEFFHTPGHTHDSSSCYDHRDRVLFVGDNVESDIPHVNDLHFDTYLATLHRYVDFEWIAMVTGHDPIQYDDKLLRSNIEYLERFKEWAVDIKTLSEKALGVHLYALAKLVDPILQQGSDERVRTHYQNAIEVLRTMERTGAVQSYIDRLSRIIEVP